MNKKIFSIIISCYNVEDYINEAINSIINQKFNFEDVEIILVDDGSLDDTGKICKKYTEKYPNNIKYIYKENGGQALARNIGIKYANGKYVNFLDADDKLMNNTLNSVYDFFENNYEEIDLVAIPMYFFERKTGPHPLNYKFIEDKVVYLDKNWNYPQLATNSAFFKIELFDKFEFDVNLINSEDSIMVNKILLEKKAYGVIKDGGLCYRKRNDNSSIIDNVKQDKRFYNNRLKGYFIELIKYSRNKLGFIPKFIQYLIIYDVKWMFLDDYYKEILNNDELDEFNKLTKYVLDSVDDEIIEEHFKKDDYKLKKRIFELKYGDYEIISKDDKISMYINNILIDELSIHKFYIDIIEIRNNQLFLSGFLRSFFNSNDVEIKLLKGNEIFNGTIFNYDNRSESEFLESTINFDFNIPLNEMECEIKLVVKDRLKRDSNYIELKIEFLNHARLSKVSNYSLWDDYLIIFKNNTFHILKYSYFKMISLELRVLKNILFNKYPYWTSAIFFRLVYLILFPIYKNKTIWMFMDRQDSADDNAEHLFNYCNDIDDSINKYFTLNENSKDFKKFNNALKFYSIKQRLLYLFADKIISSHPDESILNPFWDKNIQLYSGLINSQKIFLQHGVTKDNVSSWLRKYDKNLSMIVCVSEREAKSFLKYKYNYNSDVIKVLGFPRFDNLENINNKKQILIMPSWRRSLENLSEKQIKKTQFFKKNNSLINNEELIKIAQKNHYEIIYKPHPKIMEIIDLFDRNEFVNIDETSSYQELFNSSSLLITDFSSVAFDFAYLKKPILYYQYANDYHFKESIIDYEKNGFGEVINDETRLIKIINEYLDNNCIMKEKYKKRVENFYKYKDKNNCKRVYEAVRNL